MTDSPTSQAMHLAMTELKEREQRIAVLEEVLRMVTRVKGIAFDYDLDALDEAIAAARSVLNKETNRG